MERETPMPGMDGFEAKVLPPPSWRGVVIAVVVAVVLSVMATLLLGGSYRAGGYASARGECGFGGNCCPPADK